MDSSGVTGDESIFSSLECGFQKCASEVCKNNVHTSIKGLEHMKGILKFKFLGLEAELTARKYRFPVLA